MIQTDVSEEAVNLIEPYGGKLVDLFVSEEEAVFLRERAVSIESLVLSNRALCDLEMLATGAFSPLKTFLNQKDYMSVLETMRLNDGTLFPIPVTLPVSKEYRIGQEIALRDGYGTLLAIMTVEDVYGWDSDEYSRKVLGTNDEAHSLVKELKTWGRYNTSGELKVLALPGRRDFSRFRLTPRETRAALAEAGNENIVAFQTRNPLHRAHEELMKRALTKVNSTLLLHPAVGMTKPGDVDYVTRVRCYAALLENYFQDHRAMLCLLPLAMRMAGPREAIWHAIIRRNYGVNHFIVGRDHAGPGRNSQGIPFYDSLAAQNLARQYEDELGVRIMTFNEMTYLPGEDTYVEAHEAEGVEAISISGTQVREEYLAKGKLLPEWFTRPEVAEVLAGAYPPISKQGFCLWFTGLSGAGKSTIAQAIEAALQERGRRITMLDGDVVRYNLSKGLGFSKEDREANIARVGFVASEIVYHHGVAICALISPYLEAREKVRNLFTDGNFLEIYVSTPLATCRARDPKGHYIKTSQGKMQNFTGVDDAYEPPVNPEVTIDTTDLTIEESVKMILAELYRRGFIK